MDTKLYKLMDWAKIEAVVYSEEDHPHELLGAHPVSGGILIQAFLPRAEKVFAVVTMNDVIREYPMELVDEEGFFAVFIKSLTKAKYAYHYKVMEKDGGIINIEDAYRFPCTVKKQDIEKFNAGIHYTVYEVLGAQLREIDGVKGTSFAVWAPNAVRVSVVGDFNHWDGRVHQMRRLPESGIFEIFIPGVLEGELYKYELKLKGGMLSLKADPYGFGAQLRPGTASVVRDIRGFLWSDEKWLQERKNAGGKQRPMAVYEVHLGSFQKPGDGREFYNYRELAPMLASYVKEMGYTHVELMPVMEHPLDASWGYQVIGYYAPTSRYGTPTDFMYFMDYMHREGIAVILDWVPAHFPRDVQGLSNFDGTCLYEHQDPRQGFHPHWGTLIYNYGRPQVQNYLIASALYWINCYHADGIRMDAVASMLYLDYGKTDGEWVANIYGGNENLEAVELLKHLNSINRKQKTGALMIAEESTAWPKVTGALDDDGLGFDYKWNMGWMNDFLDFMRYDPYFRSHHYGELTFSMIYHYSEKFMLVFSHDEVVHGKASMIGKMPGKRKEQFSNLRAAYGYLMTHPGKKLTFMGQDIAELDEWNEERSVEWELLQHEEHRQFQAYLKELLFFYRQQPALYELDDSPEGFEWINNISADETVVVFLRKAADGQSLLIVCNFANVLRQQYKIGVPSAGKYKELLNSDDVKFGGGGFINPRVKQAKQEECDGREQSIKIRLAPLCISIFSCMPQENGKKSKGKINTKPAGKKKNLKKELEQKYQKEDRGL